MSFRGKSVLNHLYFTIRATRCTRSVVLCPFGHLTTMRPQPRWSTAPIHTLHGLLFPLNWPLESSFCCKFCQNTSMIISLVVKLYTGPMYRCLGTLTDENVISGCHPIAFHIIFKFTIFGKLHAHKV
ncbi:hypothetical protein FGO68_gene6743 [Halteria grandinella]|uniref:Uncharacterized protein n=1 Tax=Halteria grandinella TaxID=5974 RepID=A0A8J8STU0_HALGN|nr:hypothetical protein FGO68_gene6743 [Halteria grandinella]